jgi:hypothetical protein
MSDKAMAKEIFQQPGSNSCMYCHGIEGHGGKVQDAADFRHPTSWRSYRGLGGLEAFKKNPKGLRSKMEELLLQLIERSAPVQNEMLRDPAFSWDRAGGSYNEQMLGLLGAPSAKWLRQHKVPRERAARALLEYVKGFDAEKFWKP